jgi:hypothetical protein
MERRKLLAVAGALSATAFATTLGLGANLGLFDMTQPDSGAGRLDGTPVAATAGAPAPSTDNPQPATPATHDDGRADDD